MEDLTKEQMIKLLNLARNTIAGVLNFDLPHETHVFTDGIFNEKCGAFVTIHIHGRLRGCIGYIAGVKSIPETVEEMARASAFRDPRFQPLSKKEYEYIDIEISVLSPIKPVRDFADISVGRDGLIITRGFNSGLLLPQVATEQGWDR